MNKTCSTWQALFWVFIVIAVLWALTDTYVWYWGLPVVKKNPITGEHTCTVKGRPVDCGQYPDAIYIRK